MTLTPEQLAALKEVAEKAQQQAPEQRILMRYEHGGGRMYVERDDPDNDLRPHRDLVADFYDEASREHYAAFDPTTCLELLEEVERLRGDGNELSATIEACHAMLDKLDPEYEEGMTTLTPLDTRLQEFLWPEGRITDDMVNGDD